MRSISTWLRRHRRFVGGLTLLLTGGALSAFAIFELGDFAEKRRFAAIEPGMTEEQVLTIIGKPPGQYGPPGARYGVWFG